MPLPVVVVAAAPFATRVVMQLIARFKSLGFLEWAGIASLIDTILSYDVKQQLFKIVAEEMSNRAGLNLNPDDPFSDASVAGAVGEKLGFPIRSIKDRALIEEDVENHALALISGRSGYQISSIRDVAVLKADMERIALQILSERVGIPLALVDGRLDPAAIREQVLSWAKAEMMANIGEGAALSVQDIINAGGLEEVANDVNSRLSAMGSIEAVTARQLAVKAAEKMASIAVADFGRVAMGMDKKRRKRELQRAASAKFRAAHGNRQVYVPLGMSSNVG